MAAPRFEITPKHVIAFFKKEFKMNVSQTDARRWLKKRGSAFSLDLRDIIEPKLGDLFRNATLWDFPDRNFTRWYKRVDVALSVAADVYGEKIGLEYRSDSIEDLPLSRLVRYLMEKQGTKREGLISESVSFLPADAPIMTKGEEQTFRVHLIAVGQRVTARLLASDEPAPRVRNFDPRPRKKQQRAKPAKQLPAPASKTELVH